MGARRRSFLPVEEGRGAPTRTETSMGYERKGGDIRLRLSSPEGGPGAHPHHPFATDHRPQPHMLTHHIPLKAVGDVLTGSFPTSILFIFRTMARAPSYCRDCMEHTPVHSTQTGKPESGPNIQEEGATALPRKSQAQPGRRAGSA